MTYNSGLKEHVQLSGNILKPINKCDCLINTAFESLAFRESFPGFIVESYISDNKKRQRTVLYSDNCKALSACYYELKDGQVIYGFTLESMRKRGMYKQLKGYIHNKELAGFNVWLWSQFQSKDYMQAFNR